MLKYRSGSHAQKDHIEVQPRNGSRNTAKIGNWMVIACVPESDFPRHLATQMIERLVKACQDEGIEVVNQNPRVQYSRKDGTFKQLDKVKNQFDRPHSLAFVVLPNGQASKAPFTSVKHWGDKTGIPTQCMKLPKCLSENEKLWTSVAYQIKMKLDMVVDREELTTLGTLLGDIRNATVSTVLSPTVFFIESTILTLAIAFFIDSAVITPSISFLVELKILPAQMRVQWGSVLAWLEAVHSKGTIFWETGLMSYAEDRFDVSLSGSEPKSREPLNAGAKQHSDREEERNKKRKEDPFGAAVAGIIDIVILIVAASPSRLHSVAQILNWFSIGFCVVGVLVYLVKLFRRHGPSRRTY
ncbi:hypothetical protein K438DRAFT_440990 [Mycena galopus ATCC 62051]|nr:hypothetical protein K438DRAFT_440990 [Mycena galopus ATCC 62051]